MARPKKLRHCEGKMCGKAFKPTCVPLNELRQIPMDRDELESIRLCDKLGMTQEEAGLKMGVSRGTVQRTLTSARKKIAQALVEGAALIFDGNLSDQEKSSPD